MLKTRVLALGCNGLLGYNFAKKILTNNTFDFLGTYNKNTYRIESSELTREHKYFIKYNPNTYSRKLINVLNNFKPEVVVNFIGNSNLFEKSKSKHESQNFKSLQNILKSIESSDKKTKHFFNLGTSQEYKHSLNPLNESSPLAPTSQYAKSKLKCHKYGLKWSKSNGVKFTTLRVFNVMGNDQFKENIIIKLIKLKSDEKIVFQQYNAIRDFIYMEDFISILISLISIHNKIKHKTINIGTGVPTKISDLIGLISQSIKRDLTDNIVIKHKEKLNSNYANIDRLKKLTHLQNFKSTDEILRILIKENDKN
jgi:nucleoside-diphosphate-sugar epimerase